MLKFRLNSFIDYMRQAGSGSTGGGPRSGYDELDTTLMPPRPGEHYGRGGSGGSPANAGGGSTGSGAGGVQSGVPPHPTHHYGTGGPAGQYPNLHLNFLYKWFLLIHIFIVRCLCFIILIQFRDLMFCYVERII